MTCFPPIEEVAVIPGSGHRAVRFEVSSAVNAFIIVALTDLSGRVLLLFTWQVRQGKNITVQYLYITGTKMFQVGIAEPGGQKLYHAIV